MSLQRLKDNTALAAIALGVAWLVVQVGLFFILGIRIGKDANRYLDAAESLLRGTLPSGTALVYMSYDLFVAFFLWTGLGTAGIVLSQILLTSGAAYCLYRLALRLYDRRTGLLAALFYIGYAEIHTWNFYLMTDSLFVSLTIISLFLVVESRSWWQSALSYLAVVIASTVNPHGIALLLSVGIYILYSHWRAKNYRALVGTVCVVVVLSFVATKFVGGMLAFFSPISNYTKGTVISAYSESALKMPGTLPASLSGTDNPLFQILFFVAEKPGYFFQLVGWKLWYFFLHIRPYYSDLHNYFTLLTLIPAYVLAAWGVFSHTEYPAEKVLLVSVGFFQSVAVALTFVTWDGRYLLVVLPIVFLFAARGTWNLLETGKALVNRAFNRELHQEEAG